MSRSHPKIKSREHRVPGARAVTELLRSDPARVRTVYVEEGQPFEEIRELAEKERVPVRGVHRNELEAMVGPGLARGVVAAADSPLLGSVDELLTRAGQRTSPRLTSRGRRVLVALDGVLDPQNLGAVIRSAEFFGAVGLFYARDRAAPLSPVAVRASAGASERLPLARVANLARGLEECKQFGYWVVGTVVESGRPAQELCQELPENFVLVLGGEERGLRRLTVDRCDFLASIPGQSELASLNVACAAAVSLALLA